MPYLRVVVLDIASHPTPEQAHAACRIIKEQQCSLLFSINEWGIDSEGIIWDFLLHNSIFHINWCVDDPFFEEILFAKKFRASPNRIDFVSDMDYLPQMKALGYQAFFLPLGTDPCLFYPSERNWFHESAFVGNSYLTQVDEFARGAENFLEQILPGLASLFSDYKYDNTIDIESLLCSQVSKTALPEGLSFQRALFIAKQFAGYLYRKDVVTTLAQTFEQFCVYGDKGWSGIATERIRSVHYGEPLREIYNNTKVNIDINRLVIRNGFTQRVFDVLACKGFLITSYKPLVEQFFRTNGTDREIVTFQNKEELVTLVRYYLVHESERLSIAERGYRKVLSQHTYHHRIMEIFKTLSEVL